MSIKQELIKILWEKNSPIFETIIQNIDLFNETELNQIYLILHQTDIEKLKELFLYQNSQSKAILDRIINIAQELNHVEKHIENNINSNKETQLDELIETNLDLNYSIS
jgi:spore coat protein CotH